MCKCMREKEGVSCVVHSDASQYLFPFNFTLFSMHLEFCAFFPSEVSFRAQNSLIQLNETFSKLRSPKLIAFDGRRYDWFSSSYVTKTRKLSNGTKHRIQSELVIFFSFFSLPSFNYLSFDGTLTPKRNREICFTDASSRNNQFLFLIPIRLSRLKNGMNWIRYGANK